MTFSNGWSIFSTHRNDYSPGKIRGSQEIEPNWIMHRWLRWKLRNKVKCEWNVVGNVTWDREGRTLKNRGISGVVSLVGLEIGARERCEESALSPWHWHFPLGCGLLTTSVLSGGTEFSITLRQNPLHAKPEKINMHSAFLENLWGFWSGNVVTQLDITSFLS